MEKTLTSLIQSDIDRYVARCHFTRLEKHVFIRRAYGQSVVEVADKEHVCRSTVIRTTADILDKMRRVDAETK